MTDGLQAAAEAVPVKQEADARADERERKSRVENGNEQGRKQFGCGRCIYGTTDGK